MGVWKGGDNMRDDQSYTGTPYMSRSPKGQIGEPMVIYSGHEGKDKVCCNCRHNKRTPKKTYIDCNCDIDGHRIGYIECFDCWCRRWAREREPMTCGTCIHRDENWGSEACDGCTIANNNGKRRSDEPNT